MSLKKMLGSLRLWLFVDFYGNYSSWCSFEGEVPSYLKNHIESVAKKELGRYSRYYDDKSKLDKINYSFSSIKYLVEQSLGSCSDIEAIERYESTRVNEKKAFIYEIYKNKV